VPNHNDTQFKNDGQFKEYLQQFRPLDSEPLRMNAPARAVSRRFRFGVWAAVTACFIAGFFLLESLPQRFVRPDSTIISKTTSDATLPLEEIPPLTLGNANALLARSPSAKSAFDDIAFQPWLVHRPIGLQSALAILEKEKMKL
jgi:hypothetical protein